MPYLIFKSQRDRERERDRCTFEPTTITRPTTICWLKQVRNQLLLLRLSMKIAPKTRVDTPYPVNSPGFSHENPLPPQLPYFSNELLLKDACLLLHNPTCSVVHVFSMENMPSKWSWWLLGWSTQFVGTLSLDEIPISWSIVIMFPHLPHREKRQIDINKNGDYIPLPSGDHTWCAGNSCRTLMMFPASHLWFLPTVISSITINNH